MSVHQLNNGFHAAVPVIPVKRKGTQLIVTSCPFCGRRHVHGDAGRRERGWHGHRLAHCVGKRWTAGLGQGAGYDLVECAVPTCVAPREGVTDRA